MKYSVADLNIDTGPQLVSRDGNPIPLPKLSYDLLLVLVRAAPNLVAPDELMRLVWPGIVVSPETVSQRIKLLRDALGDDPRQPRYIAGLRGRGYQMIAAVKEFGAEPAAAAAPVAEPSVLGLQAPTERPPSLRNRVLLTAAFVVVVVALGWLLADRFWIPQPKLPSATAAVPVVAQKSIAVLPFVDMSERRDQEYFADGMSEELIDMLTKVPDLRVPARTSSFYFKGKQTTIKEIAKALGVAHVLEGSVRKSGKTLRVTAQLIRVDNGYHLWSETYDRQLDDIFKIQDEIAAAVVESLKVSLLAGTIPDSAVTYSPESYALYLRARYDYQRAAKKEDYESVISRVQDVLNIDASMAPAWALRASARAGYYGDFLDGSVQQVRTDAEGDAKRALELDPKLPDSHLAMASIYFGIDWNWDAAEREYSKALQLDAGNVSALLGLSSIALIQDRLDQALQFAQRAIEHDPLSGAAYTALARAKSHLGQNAQAEIADRKATELKSAGHVNHFWVGYDLLVLGKPAVALSEFERESDEEIRRDGLILALPALGRTQEAARIAAELERANATSSAGNLAAYYACAKDADRAFEWLDRAYSRRDGYLLVTKGDFCFKNLVHDPRYKAFRRKINLPE